MSLFRPRTHVSSAGPSRPRTAPWWRASVCSACLLLVALVVLAPTLGDASSLSIATASASSPVDCQFQSAPGAAAAFCDTLSGGAQPGGRAGDLDDGKWSVARLVSD